MTKIGSMAYTVDSIGADGVDIIGAFMCEEDAVDYAEYLATTNRKASVSCNIDIGVYKSVRTRFIVDPVDDLEMDVSFLKKAIRELFTAYRREGGKRADYFEGELAHMGVDTTAPDLIGICPRCGGEVDYYEETACFDDPHHPDPQVADGGRCVKCGYSEDPFDGNMWWNPLPDADGE